MISLDTKMRNRLIGLIILLSTIYFFVFSNNGFLERSNLGYKRDALILEQKRLRGQNSRLRLLLQKYREGYRSSADIHNSGFIVPGERLIIFRNLPFRKGNFATDRGEREDVYFHVALMRVLWIVFSAFTLLLVAALSRNKQKREEYTTHEDNLP